MWMLFSGHFCQSLIADLSFFSFTAKALIGFVLASEEDQLSLIGSGKPGCDSQSFSNLKYEWPCQVGLQD